MSAPVHECPKCEQKFFYAPAAHRCPGEWEDIIEAPLVDPYEGMTWVEEQMAKQYDPPHPPSDGDRIQGLQP